MLWGELLSVWFTLFVQWECLLQILLLKTTFNWQYYGLKALLFKYVTLFCLWNCGVFFYFKVDDEGDECKYRGRHRVRRSGMCIHLSKIALRDDTVSVNYLSLNPIIWITHSCQYLSSWEALISFVELVFNCRKIKVKLSLNLRLFDDK